MKQLPPIASCLLISAMLVRCLGAEDPQAEKPATAPPKPAAESPEKPAAESPEKPAAESPEKPAAESPEKPAAESPEKPAAESPEKPAAESPEKPATHKVTVEPFRVRVEQSGVVESSRMMEVAVKPQSSSLTLTVERAVEHGRSVKKGQTLVWLDTAKIDEQIQSAENSVKVSQLSLKESEAGLEEAESLLPLDLKATEISKKRADDDLDYFTKVTRSNSEKSAQFSLDSSRHSVEYAQEELDQLQKMYEADDLTEESEELVLKRARRSVESSKYFLESSQTRYDRTVDKDLPRQLLDLTESAKRQGLSLQKAKVTLPISLKKRQLELEKAKQAHKKSADDLAKLKRDRQALVVKSPMDGTVYHGRCTRGKWQDSSRLQEKLRTGGTLVAKQAFLTVVAMRPLKVRVDLAEKELQHVRRGVAATIRPVAFPDMELAAKVTTVGQIPLGGGIFDCLLRVEAEKVDRRLVPGMNCKVEFRIYDNEKAIAVPEAVVFKEEDDPKKSYVFVRTPAGKDVKRPVVVGRRNAEKIEIRRGLKAGEEVLLKKPEKTPE